MSDIAGDVNTAGPRTRHPSIMLGALVLGVVAYQLNATMISPAVPNIAESLSTSAAKVGFSQTMFFLVGGIAGVVLSRYSDYIGRRRILLWALTGMSVGTLACVFAPTIEVLIAGRLLQGVSGATFQLTYLLLRETMSPKAFGTAVGVITAVNGGVAGLDALAAGALADTVGFRAVFGVILLTGIIAIALSIKYVPESIPDTRGRMDWRGACALSATLTCAILGVDRGSTFGWSHPLTISLLIGVIVFGLLFWRLEKQRRDPLIATGHLRSRRVWPIMATTLLTLSGFFAAMNFTVVLLSQDDTAGYGMSATMSALVFLLPAAVVGLAAGPFAGWWAPRIGWRLAMRIGLAGSTLILVTGAVFAEHQWLTAVGFCGLGFFYYGLTLTTINALGVVLSPKESPGALPGFNGACFGIGASLGIALVAPMASAGTIDGYRAALWMAVTLAAIAFVASLMVSAPDDIEGERV